MNLKRNSQRMAKLTNGFAVLIMLLGSIGASENLVGSVLNTQTWILVDSSFILTTHNLWNNFCQVEKMFIFVFLFIKIFHFPLSLLTSQQQQSPGFKNMDKQIWNFFHLHPIFKASVLTFSLLYINYLSLSVANRATNCTLPLSLSLSPSPSLSLPLSLPLSLSLSLSPSLSLPLSLSPSLSLSLPLSLSLSLSLFPTYYLSKALLFSSPFYVCIFLSLCSIGLYLLNSFLSLVLLCLSFLHYFRDTTYISPYIFSST